MATTTDRLILDTSVLLLLARAGKLGTYIEQKYDLRARRLKPLISVVTVGEARVLARRNNWGSDKLATLDRLLNAQVVVDLNEPEVLDAYVELDLARPKGVVMGDNDLWIAATTKATRSTLLTTDKDFDILHGLGLFDRDWIDPALGKP